MVTVNSGSYTDLAGNKGTGGSDSADPDTQSPNAPTVVIVDDANHDQMLTSARSALGEAAFAAALAEGRALVSGGAVAELASLVNP